MAGDPSAIRSLAVSAEDVVDAFVYGRENPGEAVLRVTPPFHGRMRARLHAYRVDDAPETGSIHLDPARLLDDDVVDDYPTVEAARSRVGDDGDDDADRAGGDPPPERVREAHAAALERWRERALDSIVDAVAIETDAGPHLVDVKRLG
ncbi:hypothetical protein [Salinilacihabitans rarus]|uniref:hypothetical protein n=1 Tax=Salinilacihabitans rarus TaxID=2961596 RepID=UPI0020C84FE7|nr:hypothetical protein [Salinilacihabitans rarus]